MSETPRRRLPVKPSVEFLRKAAKRRAREDKLQLAEAQRRLADDHGHPTWASLIRAAKAALPRSPLFRAASRGDSAAVSLLLAEGAAPDGAQTDPGTPLWALCRARVSLEEKTATARNLLEAGAFLHSDRPGETPLHAAARTGPLEFVEFMIARGAIEWMQDRRGRTPAAIARGSKAADHLAIAEVLQRPVIRDPNFQAAVSAIHAGDAAALEQLLDQHPRLMVERIIEPDCYRQAERAQYFRDPKLLWFVADNPDLISPMPAGIIDCARVLCARRPAQQDLDTTLTLAMTSSPALESGLIKPLMTLLIEAGARPAEETITVTLGHMIKAPIEALLASGYPLTAPIAAALGRVEGLGLRLAEASPKARRTALGLAVINRQYEAASLALLAGADVDAFLPVHSHSTPLHQAAVNDDVRMLELLVLHGARDDIPDTLWRGTALGWAIHQNRPAAKAFLEGLAAERRQT